MVCQLSIYQVCLCDTVFSVGHNILTFRGLQQQLGFLSIKITYNTFYIHIGVVDGVAHTSLGGKIDNHGELVLSEHTIHQCPVGYTVET